MNTEIEKLAGEYADRHAFRVPYDGSNKFYDDNDFEWSKEGFIAGYKAALQSAVDVSAEDLHILKQIRNYFGENDAVIFHHTAFAVIDKIIKYASIKSKGAVSDEWISVEDRLPDVVDILAVTGGLRLKLTYIEGEYFTPGGSKWTTPVTHWRYLPPFPKPPIQSQPKK